MQTILMVSTLLLSLMRGVWFMEPEAAKSYLPVVASLIKGQGGDYAQLLPQTKNFTAWATPKTSDANLVAPDFRYGFKGISTKNSIAIVPLNGAIMKYDNCGTPGTKTLAQYYQQIQNNPNIIGSIMIGDTPGGSADGTGAFSDYLASLPKPSVMWTDGMICSAGYWIGSSHNEIIAGYKTDIVGSIGTYVTLYDYREMMAEMGVKELSIYATASTQKNKIFADAIDGKPEQLIKQVIDPFNESFMSGVKKNRYGKGISKEAFTGRTYMAKEAIDAGLVDSIGDFDYAIQRVQKLAKV